MNRLFKAGLIVCCISLVLALGLAGCGEEKHQHTLVKTEAKAATCTEAGSKAYWTCSGCALVFSDETATQEITPKELILEATGHDPNVQTGICQLCAKQYDYLHDEATRTYTVYTADGLYAWAKTRDNLVLAKDITLPGEMNVDLDGDGTNESNWNPVHTSATIDGNGHSISGLTILTGNTVGFLHRQEESGTVKNLILKDVRIEGNTTVGGIVGYNYGTVLNCSVSGSISGTSSNIGGIAGTNFGGHIIACHNEATIFSENGAVGGIVGQYNKGSVIACVNTGSVSAYSHVGGITGNYYAGQIIACYSTGTVTAESPQNPNTCIGGIAGYCNGQLLSNYWSMAVEDVTIPGDGFHMNNNNAEFVDGESITWANAMDAMNAALENAGSQWRYAANDSDASQPLVLESLQ